jgi:hypothetical protein
MTCAAPSDTCTSTIKLDSAQYVPVLLLLAVPVLLGLASFVITHGRPWRV